MPRLDPDAIAIWVLAGGLVLYLGIDGGGYDLVVHSRVALAIWWLVLLGALSGLLPVARASRQALAASALFAAFVGWTAIATTWSLSFERSLAALSLVAGYLGALVLAVLLHRDRGTAIRHTIAATAMAITAIAVLALVARLQPQLFPGAQQTGAYLPGTQRRLGWPLNYWNAMAALMAFGLPLLLGLATSARTLRGQAMAAAAVPVVLLCAYLTFSRGGAIAIVIAAVAFVALASNRFAKLASVAAGAIGGAVLILGATHRSAIENGLADPAARHQGATLLVALILVCIGTGLIQVGIGLAVRHGNPPRFLVISPRRARQLLAVSVGALVIAAVAADIPSHVSHAWKNFKNDNVAALSNDSIARFGTLSGNGRYDYWKVSVNSVSGRVLQGSGPGTFQFLWLPHSPRNFSYIQNAHSLYFETLAEVGVVGLVLLVGFLALVLASAVRLVLKGHGKQRTRAAAVSAAMVAFVVSAGSDWIWQMPVLPVAFILLAAAVLAPGRHSASRRPVPRGVLRAFAAAAALACVVAVGIPLMETDALRASQAKASSGNMNAALRDARSAAGWEPGAASPQTQIALLEERLGDLHDALLAAQRANRDEPANWSTWLILARIDAEAGRSGAATAAFNKARSLNPASQLFSSL